MKKYKKYIIVVVLVMGMQGLSYFLIKNFINDYHIITSFVDVPLIKYFIYFYDLWYPFIVLNTFIIYKYDRKLFSMLIATMLIATVMAHLTFIIYPSMVLRPDVNVTGITSWLLDFTYRTDTPAINCLPSMHCIYCFVTSYYIIKCKNMSIKKRLPVVTFSALIVLSTIFIKQHILEDVILAFIYVVIAIIVVHILRNKITKYVIED